jgi:hypothetical protein
VSRIRASDQRLNPFEEFGRGWLPTWRDRDGVIKMVCGCYLKEVEEDPLPEEVTDLKQAVARAEQGDVEPLIRMVRKRGHGKRGPEARAKKMRRTKTHRAAALAYLAKLILRDLYPAQTSADVRDRAIETASAMTGVGEDTIANYLRRSRKNRRRLV